MIINLLFAFQMAFAGLSVKTELASYTVYSYDSSRIILQATDTKQKWVMARSQWFSGQKPTIGKKVFLAGSIKQQLTPHR